MCPLYPLGFSQLRAGTPGPGGRGTGSDPGKLVPIAPCGSDAETRDSLGSDVITITDDAIQVLPASQAPL